MSKKNDHPFLKAAAITAGAAAGAYAGVSAYIFHQIFNLAQSDLYSGKGGTAFLTFKNGEKAEWFHNSVREDDTLNSFDGLKLHALRLQNHPDSHNWVVLAFGPGSYAGTLLDYLYALDQAGFNVLAADSRGCGKSEGKYTTLGWAEHYDLISWVNYLVNLDPDARIALYGVSIGANAVMNAVGDYIPRNVVCGVAQGGFSDVNEVLVRGISHAMKADGRIVMPGVELLVRQILHFSLKDVSTVRQLKQASVPMLFVQGNTSEFVPESMLFDNYYACGSERELLTKDDLTDDTAGLITDYLKSKFNA